MANGTCSIDGCDRKHRARGWCDPHWKRWRKYGDPLAGGTPLGEPMAFIEEVLAAEPTDECVEWPYATAKNGYGVVWGDGRVQRAHRYVLTLTTGENPPGLDAAHTPGVCHNRACVNPAHLRWASRAENQADRVADGTDNRGEKNGRAKLTAEQVIAIRGDNRTQRVVAEQHGISQQTVSEIKRLKNWGWLA